MHKMTRVDMRRGEQWQWMIAIKMSNAPVVVAETALTLSRGTRWDGCKKNLQPITRKNHEFKAVWTEDK